MGGGSVLGVRETDVGDGDVVELDAAHTVKVDDDMTVVVDAHEDTLGTLELTGDDDDVTALLGSEGSRVDVGEGVLVVVDHIHETVHLGVRDDDRSTPRAVEQLVAAILHVTQFIDILLLQLIELVLMSPDDDEVEDGWHQLATGLALVAGHHRPFHRHEALDVVSVEEVLHTEYLLRTGIVNTQRVPMEGCRLWGESTRGSCRLCRGHSQGDCMCIITLH